MSPDALQIARRVLSRENVHGVDGRAQPEVAGAALQQACIRVSDNLRDAMGEAGCTALIARALARTETNYPALKNMRRLTDSGIHFDGVIASVKTHGVAETTANFPLATPSSCGDSSAASATTVSPIKGSDEGARCALRPGWATAES